MERCIRIMEQMVYLQVKVIPGASKSQVLGVKEGRLRVKIAAAPEDGKANTELCLLLAKLLDCPKREVHLRMGAKSRIKTLEFPLYLREKLEKLVGTLPV